MPNNISSFLRRHSGILSGSSVNTERAKRAMAKATIKTNEQFGKARDYVQSRLDKIPLEKLSISSDPFKGLFRPANKATGTHRVYSAPVTMLPKDPDSVALQHQYVLQLLQKLQRHVLQEGILRRSGSQKVANDAMALLVDGKAPDTTSAAYSANTMTTALKTIAARGYVLIPRSHFEGGEPVADPLHAEVVEAAERLFYAIDQKQSTNLMTVENVATVVSSFLGLDTLDFKKEKPQAASTEPKLRNVAAEPTPQGTAVDAEKKFSKGAGAAVARVIDFEFPPEILSYLKGNNAARAARGELLLVDSGVSVKGGQLQYESGADLLSMFPKELLEKEPTEK